MLLRALKVLVVLAVAMALGPVSSARADSVPPTLSVQLIPGSIGVTAVGDGDLELSVGPDDAHLVGQGQLQSGVATWLPKLTPGATYVVSVSADGASPVESTVEMPTDMVVYASNMGVAGRVVADGGAVDGQPYEQNLAPADACETNAPAISPDRSEIAYTYSDCVNWHLVVQDARSGARTELDSTPVGQRPDDQVRPPLREPAWSPDGGGLAYLSCPWSFGGYCTLVWRRLGDVTASQIQGMKNMDRPIWSPDGSSIIVTERGYYVDPDDTGRTALVVAPTDGGAVMEIPGASPAATAALSPDGSTLAFAQDTSYALGPLTALPSSGGAATVLGLEPGHPTMPAWSTDASTLWFQKTDPVAGGFRVWSRPVGARESTELPVRDGWDAEAPAVWAVDAVAPVVHLGLPAYVSADPALPFTATDATSLIGSLTFRCSVDGSVATACTSPYQPGHLAPGDHTLTVVASDPSSNDSKPVSQHFRVDAVAPTKPTVTVNGELDRHLGFTTGHIRLMLASSDSESGVAHFQLRRESAQLGHPSGTWGAWGSVPATSTPSVPPGHRVCFEARALDVVGNTSAASPAHCFLTPHDDRSFHATHWTRAHSAAAIQGTVSVASARGAVLSRSGFHGRHVLLVVREAPGVGVLAVVVGHISRSVILGSRVDRGYVVVDVDLGATTSGTLKLVKSSIGGAVSVDAVAWI